MIYLLSPPNVGTAVLFSIGVLRNLTGCFGCRNFPITFVSPVINVLFFVECIAYIYINE